VKGYGGLGERSKGDIKRDNREDKVENYGINWWGKNCSHSRGISVRSQAKNALENVKALQGVGKASSTIMWAKLPLGTKRDSRGLKRTLPGGGDHGGRVGDRSKGRRGPSVPENRGCGDG